MSRLKKTSPVIEKALSRLAGLKSISPTLNLGNGLTVAAYTKEIEATESALEAYNTLLSKVDDALNQLNGLEKSSTTRLFVFWMPFLLRMAEIAVNTKWRAERD